jgi:hypothetical protein
MLGVPAEKLSMPDNSVTCIVTRGQGLAVTWLDALVSAAAAHCRDKLYGELDILVNLQPQ